MKIDSNFCKQCGELLDISKAWWDEKGYGYSTKLVRCSCGKIQSLQIIQDLSFDVNNDLRFYSYVRK